MAFAPNTSTFVTTALDNVDLPNSQVLAAGAGLQIISSGPGGNVTINPTQNLLSLTQIATDGMLAINHSTNTIFTRTLTSDGTLTITNPNGVAGSPLFSVTPESQVQLIQVSANGGSIVGSAPTINFAGAGNTSVSAVNEGSFINVVISSTGGGGSGVTQVNTGTGLTGGPITSTGTVSLANTAVTAGSYTSANITVNAQGQITAASNGSGGGAVSSVTSSNNNQILASPTTGSVLLSLPNALIAPGTFQATTSVTTPILSITGAFNNPWTTQPVSNGQVLSCTTGGVFAWIDNGSGGSGVSSVGLTSPLNSLTIGTTTSNPITSTGTFHADLSNPCTTPGNFNVNGVLSIFNQYNFPATAGSAGQVITSTGGTGTAWQTPSGGNTGITSNVLYCNATTGPTLQTQVTAAIVASTSGNIYTVVASPGAFPASPTTLTISGASNGVGLQGFVNSGSSAPNVFGNTNINGDLVIGTSSSIVLNDVNVVQNTTISLTGTNYFNNMTFVGTVEVQGTTGTIVFSNCTFVSPVTVDIGFTGTCVFINCNFVNQTPTFNQANPLNVQIQRCFGIPSSTISNCTFAGLNTLSNSPYNTVLNEPIINIPGTGQYALPTNTPTSGYVIQATSSTTSSWMPASGGIPSGTGTNNQVLVNNTFGSPQTGPLTFGLPTTLIAPGTVQATTSLTTPALSMSGSGYTYQLPVTTGSAPTNGLFLQYQSAGGGQCVWAAGGGGGAVSSVSAGGTYHSGLLISPTTGAVVAGWDPSNNVVLPQSLELNGAGAGGTQYSFPTTAGVPGSTLRWPEIPTGGVYQLYWENPYLVLNVTSSEFIVTTAPTYTGSPFLIATVSLPASGTLTFPGELSLTEFSGISLTITGSPFTVTGSNPLNPWSPIGVSPGGAVVCDTSGNITYNNSFSPPITQTAQSLAFTFDGAGAAAFTPNISYSISGTIVTARIDISSYISGLTCNGSGSYIALRSSSFLSTASTPILPCPTNLNQANTFLGSLPIYNSSTSPGESFYSYWYLVQTAADMFSIVCSLGVESGAALGTFVSSDVYFFGVDGNLSSPANALTFTYSIHP